MLKTIIKRSGVREEFIPNKLNKWGIWASGSLKDRVDWSSVVLNTVRRCPEIIHSQDLQKSLIDSCLEFRDWPHNKMAGRLYAVYMRKSLYPNGIPTISQLHQELQHLGLMRKLNYTEEEYNHINDAIIQHDRDLDYAHYQIHHIIKKYSIQNRNSNVKYETPQFTFIRMAMALAETETQNKLEHVKNWYDHLSLNRLNAPTPNYINLGTPHQSYTSCCLYVSNDSAKSLAIGDHIAYTMTYRSSGIGANINSRSIGDSVGNGRLEHQGKLPYYKALAGAIKANLQAGRGGACTTYYSAYDPEALSIALLQNPRTPRDKQNRDLHFAVMFNRFFAKKVIENGSIFTFNVYTAPDLVEAFYSGDEYEFEKIYYSYENNPTFKKNYVSARKLLLTFAQQSYDIATHYYVFIDEINRHTPFIEPIYSSNLCVAPNTKILTKDGWVAIESVANQNVEVWNGQEFSETTVHQTSEMSKLIRVNLSNGHFIDCTEYHKFYVQDKNGIIELRAGELKPFMKLIDFDLPTMGGSELFNIPYSLGEYFSENLESPLKQNYTTDSRIQWISGILDYYSYWDESRGIVIQLETNSTVLRQLSLEMQTLGVKTSIDLSDYTIILLPKEFAKLINLGLRLYKVNYDNKINQSPLKDVEYSVHVYSVEDLEHHDRTYCFTESKRHMGMFNGVLTGQCLEITEPTQPYESMVDLYSKEDHGRGEVALCNLAAINVAAIDKEDDELYSNVMYYALKMIDKTIHQAEYELPHVEYTAKQRLNAGVGIIGLAYELAKRGVDYTSLEGRNAIHRIAERHAYHAISQSLRLGKELGNAPWIHKTKWPHGWLPIDTYKKSIDELTTEKLHYDWENLRQAIIDNGGIRNSCLIAHMPTESSSKASSVPNGVYPIRDLHLKKTDATSVIDWCAPDGDTLSNIYQSAWSIPSTELIKCYAILQKFADHAISADLYQDRTETMDITTKQLIEEFLAMVKYGIKTRYYQNSLTSKSNSSITNAPVCEGGSCTL